MTDWPLFLMLSSQHAGDTDDLPIPDDDGATNEEADSSGDEYNLDALRDCSVADGAVSPRPPGSAAVDAPKPSKKRRLSKESSSAHSVVKPATAVSRLLPVVCV
jgi:hypothetical protein